MTSYIPLTTGLLLPIATFINFQAITAPGWLASSDEHSLFVWQSVRPKEPTDAVNYVRQREALILCSMSLLSGVISTISLFLRMLEKKIKWTTRLFIIGAYGQGILSLILALFFILTLFTSQKAYQFAEGIVYTAICALGSLLAAGLAHYQQFLNREQIYVYIQSALSAAQRQLILLSITTLTYLIICALLYSSIEGWDIDDGLYWTIVTLATIGFGDIVPKTVVGRCLLPVIASAGIVVIASHIYAIRNVLLEMITYSLASQFSKKFAQDRPKNNHPRLSLQESQVDQKDVYYQVNGDPLQSPSFPIKIVPASDEFQNHHHSNYDALDLAARETRLRKVNSLQRVKSIQEASNGSLPHLKHNAMSPLILPDPRLPYQPSQLYDGSTSQLPPPFSSESHQTQAPEFNVSDPFSSRTISIKRSDMLPHMYIHTTNEASRSEHRNIIFQVTQQTFRRQMMYAALAVVLNITVFGGLFAYIENWSFLEGVYFSYIALMTIGYGDYSLATVVSQSLFIWHVFAGIASITYLSSMVAERAMNQWTVQVAKIEKRVDRYAQKATLKKLYKSKKSKTVAIAQSSPLLKSDQREIPRQHLPSRHTPPRANSVFYHNGNLTDTPTQEPRDVSFNHGTVQVEAPYSMSVPTGWNWTHRRRREKRKSFPIIDSTDDEDLCDSLAASSDDGLSEKWHRKGKQPLRRRCSATESSDVEPASSTRILGWCKQVQNEPEKEPLLK